MTDGWPENFEVHELMGGPQQVESAVTMGIDSQVHLLSVRSAAFAHAIDYTKLAEKDLVYLQPSFTGLVTALEHYLLTGELNLIEPPPTKIKVDPITGVVTKDKS